MSIKKFSFLIIAVFALSLISSQASSQECKPCLVKKISWAKPSSLRSLAAEKMESKEVFDGGLKKLIQRPKRLKAFNWSCVASGVAAYISCSTAKRGERLGLLKRIFQRK
jgi:hypothetical protein